MFCYRAVVQSTVLTDKKFSLHLACNCETRHLFRKQTRPLFMSKADAAV